MFESEVFGHVRGAFSGADQERSGLFRAARGGTFFLDEIGELPRELQAKLLRVLERRSIRSVGSDRSTPVDVRLVAATNADVRDEARFRADLLDRLGGLTIDIPPLRERPRADFDALVHHVVHTERMHLELTVRALDNLASRRWMGNVRELIKFLRKLRADHGPGPIEPTHLPPEPGPSGPGLDAALDACKRRGFRAFCGELARTAVEREEGNVSAAARAIGLQRKALVGMIRPAT